MSNYILKHKRIDCIGCSACEEVAPDYWKMGVDGKVNLRKQKIKKKDLRANQDAVHACPVGAIKVVNLGG